MDSPDYSWITGHPETIPLPDLRHCSAGCEQSIRKLPLLSPPTRIPPLHESERSAHAHRVSDGLACRAGELSHLLGIGLLRLGLVIPHQTEKESHGAHRHGKLKIIHPKKRPVILDQPSVIFYPRPSLHRFQARESDGVEIVCAQIWLGAGVANPLTAVTARVHRAASESNSRTGSDCSDAFCRSLRRSSGSPDSSRPPR